MIRFAIVWDKHTPLTGASLYAVRWEAFNSLTQNFYTVFDIPNPDELTEEN
jgi:hypothetical protein